MLLTSTSEVYGDPEVCIKTLFFEILNESEETRFLLLFDILVQILFYLFLLNIFILITNH